MARTIPAVGRVLTLRRQVVIHLRAGVIRPQAADTLLQAVRTLLHHIHRRRLAGDRQEAGVLQAAAVAEAEAVQDRTAGKGSIKSKRKKPARRAGFFI